MNKDERRGIADNVKGRVREAVGALTGNKSQEANGAVERARGAVEEAIGHGKHDVATKLTKSSSDEDRDDGSSQNAVGRVEQAEGILTGDKALERDGMGGRTRGAAKRTVEDLKHAVQHAKRAVAKKLDQ